METIKYKNLNIKIEQDTNASNPRLEYEHLGTLVCFHKRLSLGDTSKLTIKDYEEIEKSNDYYCLPVYAYEHGDITIATKPFGCIFDSGKLGIIFVLKTQAKLEGLTKTIALSNLEGEIKEYNSYLTGDVWGYSIETLSEDAIDSCWGFYGYDYCLGEAKRQASWWTTELAKQARKEKKEAAWYVKQL